MTNSCTCGCECDPCKIKFVNLTGEIVRIYSPEIMKLIDSEYAYIDIGYDSKVFNSIASLIVEPSGITLSDKNVKMNSITKPSFTLYGERYTGTMGIPESEEDTLYIVTKQVQKAYHKRNDLVVPFKPVKCYGVAENGPEDVVIGYCGFYKPYLEEDDNAPEDSLLITKPTRLSGVSGDKININVQFSEVTPSGAEFSVTYTPVNCAVIDESVDPAVTITSGMTKLVTGKIDVINNVFTNLFCVVGSENGFIKLMYGNSSETTIPVKVTNEEVVRANWDDIEGKPAVFPPEEHKHVVGDLTDFDPATYATKDDIKDVVKTQEFTYQEQVRKTIQLNNCDNISGLDTSGTGHNLAMVSKQDVANFGASGLHCNLNSKDTVTINDDKTIATTDQIPSLDEYLKTSDAESVYLKKEDTIDATKISGIINVSNLPASAVSELKEVANDTARFALTKKDIQNGDHVKVTDTDSLYIVIDDNKLNEEAGYTKYTATVDWSSITSKPSTFTPVEHTHTVSQITDNATLLTKQEAQSTYATKDELTNKVDTSQLSNYVTTTNMTDGTINASTIKMESGGSGDTISTKIAALEARITELESKHQV